MQALAHASGYFNGTENNPVLPAWSVIAFPLGKWRSSKLLQYDLLTSEPQQHTLPACRRCRDCGRVVEQLPFEGDQRPAT
jgi:hypothetical protein